MLARDRLRRELAAKRSLRLPASEAIGELSLRDNHPADLASETFERERDEGLIQVLLDGLDRIEAALGRMADGSYGRCLDCCRPIPARRLQAIPDACRCRRCQEVAEAARPPLARGRSGGYPGAPFRRGWDDAGDTGCDAEDAWQDVLQHGPAHSHSPPPGDVAFPERESYSP